MQYYCYDPQILKLKNNIIFSEGFLLKNFIKLEKRLLPWISFNDNFSKNYYILKFIKNLLNFNFKILIKNKSLIYCTNTFSNNYFHWFTEVIPKIIYYQNLNNSFDLLLVCSNLSNFQVESLKMLGINYLHINKKMVFINSDRKSVV